MARLLPSTADATAESEPRVIGLDSEDADDLLAAMSSDTARELLCALHEDPAAPSELADRVDTSLQNAQYHLDNLREAGAIEVVDTAYSEKGREMKVYAPADKPLVVVAGDDEETSGLRSALASMIGGLGVLAVLGAAINVVFGDSATDGQVTALDTAPSGSAGGGAPFPIDPGSPGVVFFLGGATVLLLGFAVWYARAR